MRNQILVEGKNDELTLLREKEGDDEIKILDCKSADNILMFANLPYVQNNEKKPTIVCLFDHDDKGKEAKKTIDDEIENKNSFCGNTVKTMFVSETEGDRMEDVLKCDQKKESLIKKIKDLYC